MYCSLPFPSRVFLCFVGLLASRFLCTILRLYFHLCKDTHIIITSVLMVFSSWTWVSFFIHLFWKTAFEDEGAGFMGRVSFLSCIWVEVLRPTRHKIGHFGDVSSPADLLTITKEYFLSLNQQCQSTGPRPVAWSSSTISLLNKGMLLPFCWLSNSSNKYTHTCIQIASPKQTGLN